ncbi:8608_t:CDS:1 [Gigaspora margarita]|uniref:8608_t:CDS:1 n=1 Tax=Gigaspora margarita TaxID=4874 RepID=A0ABN7VWG9_GIGMA|nr:8608_t:CDS:1 [Gigaspora margarita]
MLTHIHQKFYQSNATHLFESDIIEIRESRGKIPNASKRIAKKFHIGAHCVYEIWEHNERLQQDLNSLLPFDSDNSSILNDFKNKKSSAIETSIKKIKSKPVHILNQPSINKNLTEKLSAISLKVKKETILSETLQETEDPLEFYKRTQKEIRKVRTDARADISKVSTSNLKV